MVRGTRIAVVSALLMAMLAVVAAPPAEAKGSKKLDRIQAGVEIVDFDPLMDDGTPLTVARGWSDIAPLQAAYVSDVATASGGIVKHRLLHTTLVRDYPAKPGGFHFTNATYQECFVGDPSDACKALIDYGEILNTPYNPSRGSACDALRRGKASEVWLWGGPWFGFLEWTLVPAMTLCPTVNKPFVVMGFSYERSETDMLHDLAHRAEGLIQAGIGIATWDRFDGQRGRYVQDFFCPTEPDASHPEIADPSDTHAGNAHFPPNAFCHYQFDRDFPVMSDAYDWANFPNLTGRQTLINYTTWGGTEQGFTMWWLGLFPRRPGTVSGVETDWWRYLYPGSTKH